MREQDRRRIAGRATRLRREADDLEQLLAVVEKLDAELEDARAYADRLEKVLALRDHGACLGEHGDRCHHWFEAYPTPAIPGQRRPPLIEVIGKREERRNARRREARLRDREEVDDG